MSEASTESVGHLVKKLSPIEWVVIVSAGLGVIVFLRYRKAQQAAQPDNTALLDQLSGTGGLAGLLAGGNQSPTGNQSQTTSGAPLDNEDWARQATAALLGHGGYTPLDINQAFANFLSGQPLTQLQQQIINQAETLFGAPPLSVPNITLAPPPEANPPAAPVPQAPPDWLSNLRGVLGDIGLRQPAPPAPVAAPPAPAPVGSYLPQGVYLGAFLPENIGSFTGAGGYLDKFFSNPTLYRIEAGKMDANGNIVGAGRDATTSEVLADLRARGITIRPNWQAIN